IHISAALVALDRLGGERVLIAGVERDLVAAFQSAGAHLGPLGVEQGGHGGAQLAAQFVELGKAGSMFFIRSVGKIEAGDVHSASDELTQDVLVCTGGTERADYLGSLHRTPPF